MRPRGLNERKASMLASAILPHAAVLGVRFEEELRPLSPKYQNLMRLGTTEPSARKSQID
jgi:hypothetical protein